MSSVLFEEKEGWGIITLNMPHALNSLNLEMIHLMKDKLSLWKDDEKIMAVMLEGAGEKAFCAGGDVVALHGQMVRGDETVSDFFKYEYDLDFLIHEYKKPIVCLATGIVMGGGIGIMNGCSHRIVSPSTKMAMPEISIGFFPDVGGGWFLNKTPGNTGLYLALTGARFGGADALFLNMADHFVSDIPSLKRDLLKDAGEISSVMEKHSQKPSSQLELHQDSIERLMDISSIEEFYEKAGSLREEKEWIQKGLKSFLAGSPTSAAVVFEQIKREKSLSLSDVFQLELIMATQFTRGHDFKEGVRALLVDKDHSPRWNPDSISSVDHQLIDKHFQEV